MYSLSVLTMCNCSIYGERLTSASSGRGNFICPSSLVGGLQSFAYHWSITRHSKHTQLGQSNNQNPTVQGNLKLISSRMLITSWQSQTLDTLHTYSPQALALSLPKFMITSLNHLCMLYTTFSYYYLSATEAVLSTLEDESIELPQLLYPIIDFVSAVIRDGKCHQ